MGCRAQETQPGQLTVGEVQGPTGYRTPAGYRPRRGKGVGGAPDPTH